MKKIILLLLFSVISTLELTAQYKECSLANANLKLLSQSNTKYFSVNQKFIFEYGIMFCITRKETVVSTGSATYDLNLIAKKLYGCLQFGAFIAHGEEKASGGVLFGFGFDYSVYTNNKYNFSIYLGSQGLLTGFFPAAFGVVHLRNSIITDDIGAFTFGLRYLPQLGTSDHWLMPTLGYQYWLK